MKIQLTKEDMEQFRRPINGNGGFQTLLRRLRAQINPQTNELDLRESDMEKIERYSSQYGLGGFQDRIKQATGRIA